MIVFTVKEVEINQIDAHGSFECAVFVACPQLIAVELRPVKQRSFTKIRLIIDLHFHIDRFTVHIHLKIEPAEFLLHIFRRKLYIAYRNFLYTLARDLKKSG